MFARILCANDGSERPFRALTLAITIEKAAGAELHMVSVEEIDYMPEFIEEIREQTGTAARRFHKAHQRARALAEAHQWFYVFIRSPGMRYATSLDLPTP